MKHFNKITLYIKEFLGVCRKIERDNAAHILDKYFLITSEELITLLARNKFDTEQHKLKIWKMLNWIKCDADRYDCKITVCNERKRYIVIYRNVYECLKNLNIE